MMHILPFPPTHFHDGLAALLQEAGAPLADGVGVEVQGRNALGREFDERLRGLAAGKLGRRGIAALHRQLDAALFAGRASDADFVVRAVRRGAHCAEAAAESRGRGGGRL